MITIVSKNITKNESCVSIIQNFMQMPDYVFFGLSQAIKMISEILP